MGNWQKKRNDTCIYFVFSWMPSRMPRRSTWTSSRKKDWTRRIWSGWPSQSRVKSATLRTSALPLSPPLPADPGTGPGWPTRSWNLSTPWLRPPPTTPGCWWPGPIPSAWSRNMRAVTRLSSSNNQQREGKKQNLLSHFGSLGLAKIARLRISDRLMSPSLVASPGIGRY